MPRFTISHHQVDKESAHYDIFLERDGSLKSWKLVAPKPVAPSFTEPQKIFEAKDHAMKYLEFQGKLSGDRGEVTAWDTGVYLDDSWSPAFIQVALKGKKLQTRLKLTRLEGSDPVLWTLEDPTPPVRRVMTALLQEPTPDPPPAPELDGIGDVLTSEEQTLVMLANQFIRGGEVEWTLAETDKEMRTRIQGELAKWRHPWLKAAHRRAVVLDELAKTIASGKPRT